jgi:oligoribonuclease
LARRWHPAIAKAYSKESAHLARADIYESISELRYYREHLLVKP